MITLKSAREIEGMKKAGALLASIHEQLRPMMVPALPQWNWSLFDKKLLKQALSVNKLALKAMSMWHVYPLMMKFVTASRT